jgi:hypothetical protein
MRPHQVLDDVQADDEVELTIEIDIVERVVC